MNKITKKATFIVALLFINTCLFASNPKVIINPTYEVKNTGIYNITKIELGETSTRIYMHSIFIPHWWVDYPKEIFIKDTETAKVYNIVGIENGEFSKKIWMPDSGDSTVVLLFPPLEKTVRKIDYICYDGNIYGISLDKKVKSKKTSESIPVKVNQWFETELTKVPRQLSIDFTSDSFFKADTARLVGYLKGYDTRFGLSTGIIYASNELTREDYPIVVQIHSDGRFEAKIPIEYPKIQMMMLNKQAFEFYLEPGQTLAMILNWNEFLTADRQRNIRYHFNDIEFKGPLAKINSEINTFRVNQFDYNEFQKKVETLAPVDFKKEQLIVLDKNLKEANEYIQKNAVSTQTASILRNKMVLEYGTSLFDFLDTRSYKARQDSTNKILKLPVPDDYYDFLKKIPVNDNNLLVNHEFSTFINRLEYCSPLNTNSSTKSIQPKKNIVEFLTEKNYFKSPSDKDLFILLIQPVKNEKETKELESKKDYILTLSTIYKKEISEYADLYFNSKEAVSMRSNSLTECWKLKDSLLANRLRIAPGLISEIIKTRSLKFIFKNLTPDVANTFWTALNKSITTPFLAKTGERMYLEAFPEKTKTAYSLPTGKATEVFRKITDPYKGKILFVDFWATTCGPCVGGIKAMKETREKYKGNPDFDFIFITDEGATPEEDYKKFIGEQAMKNTFRLTVDDYNYLRELFKFNGIPRYVVIDKEGKVLNDDFEMHNFETELTKIRDNKDGIN